MYIYFFCPPVIFFSTLFRLRVCFTCFPVAPCFSSQSCFLTSWSSEFFSPGWLSSADPASSLLPSHPITYKNHNKPLHLFWLPPATTMGVIRFSSRNPLDPSNTYVFPIKMSAPPSSSSFILRSSNYSITQTLFLPPSSLGTFLLECISRLRN